MLVNITSKISQTKEKIKNSNSIDYYTMIYYFRLLCIDAISNNLIATAKTYSDIIFDIDTLKQIDKNDYKHLKLINCIDIKILNNFIKQHNITIKGGE